MGKIENYLEEGAGKGASDIHLVSGSPVMFRVDGALVSASEEKLRETEIQEILQELLSREQREEFRQQGVLDAGCLIAGRFRVRIHAFRARGGSAIALRILSMTAPEGKSLGIPASVWKLTEKKSGLVLMAGAAGSGRTTTLAAIDSADDGFVRQNDHYPGKTGRISVFFRKIHCFTAGDRERLHELCRWSKSRPAGKCRCDSYREIGGHGNDRACANSGGAGDTCICGDRRRKCRDCDRAYDRRISAAKAAAYQKAVVGCAGGDRNTAADSTGGRRTCGGA